MLKCHCTDDLRHDCESDSEEGDIGYCKNAKYCFVSRDIIDGQLIIQQGCQENEEYCHTRRPDHLSVTTCCNSVDFCNNETMIQELDTMFPTTQLSSTTDSPHSLPNLALLYTSLAILALFVVLLAIFIYRITRPKKKALLLSSNDKHLANGRLVFCCRCFRLDSWLLRQIRSPVTEMYYQQPMFSPAITDNSRFSESTVITDNSHEIGKLTATSEVGEPSSSVLPTQQTYLTGDNAEPSISGSGSGRGQPLLVPQTVARSVRLIEVIGRGRYGEVWRGEYYGEKVAVKIFASRDEASWHRESYIFNHTRLRHDNIVNFFAADVFGRGSTTELWLIISYHQNGSLFDYLMKTLIDVKTLLRFATSAARGLHYLHSPIGMKPAMAHRDMKSKNLLVKDDMTLCIADLGLVAIEEEEDSWKQQFGENKVGTRRYMAPEMLAVTSINQASHCFLDLLRADIYSFALVLWELLSRLQSSANPSDREYHPPYYEIVSPEPSVDEMIELLITRGARPSLALDFEFVSQDKPLAIILQRYWRLTCECWDACPGNRPLTLLVKKTLCQLENGYIGGSGSDNINASLNI